MVTQAPNELIHFFHTRLIKKKERKEDPWEEPQSDLVKCIEAFKDLVKAPLTAAMEGSMLNAKDWEESCEEFSEKWKNFTHWVCPVRLVEYMAIPSITWNGELNERRKTPPRSFLRKKEKRPRNDFSRSVDNHIPHACAREYTDEGLRELLASLAVVTSN
eukprot:TRINITY_DN5789_c1_g1_i1.p1 TRINITY_DN5789_c1_g1~~TRINITY_DN5789_c1_g1_i1.p1  ORF type:complete len:160 (+),score=37.48 TRINITY_DN5789_c1_g1_i1:64-543(+)